MKKLFIVFAVLIPALVSAQREAYVVNGLAETLSMIDLETGIVQNHIVTLGETPNQVMYHDDYLYVVNSISADVMKINVISRQIEHNFLLPIGSNPYNIAFSGNYGYVTGWVSGKVYKLDLSSNTIVGEVEIGGFPEGAVVYNGFLYVSQTYFNPDNFSYGQGKIAKIDISDFSFISDYNVGKNPQWISVAPDGRLHIVCTGNYADVEGSIYIFDPASGAVADSILMGGQPSQLAISPMGVGYLSAGGWSGSGLIYSYDIFSGDILRGPSNPINAGLGVTAIASDSLGFIYSCNFGDDSVNRIDLSGQIANTFALGDGPLSITIIDDIIIGIEDPGLSLLPETSYLTGSYPNPFNGGTMIKMNWGNIESTSGSIDIFDISGRLVKTMNVEISSGVSTVFWSGYDNSNKECGSGIYFAKINGFEDKIGHIGQRRALKMTIIR